MVPAPARGLRHLSQDTKPKRFAFLSLRCEKSAAAATPTLAACSVCRTSSLANGCKYKYCLRFDIWLRRANQRPVGAVFGRAIFAAQLRKRLSVFLCHLRRRVSPSSRAGYMSPPEYGSHRPKPSKQYKSRTLQAKQALSRHTTCAECYQKNSGLGCPKPLFMTE